MKTIYIHIGTHKTGTTSIQNFLFKNRKKLIDRGFLYPLSGIPKRKNSFGHSHLVTVILENTEADTYNPNAGGWQELLAEANSLQEKNIVISSENFCISKFNLEQIYKIKNYLSQYTVKIIIYLRRQDDYLISKYCQLIRAGKYSQNFKQYIIDEKWIGDYYQLLKPWKEVFGIKNIIVRVFEKEQLKNSLIDDFLDSIKYPQDRSELIKTPRQNISPSIKQIKFNQYYNKIVKDCFSLTPKQYQNIYLAKLNNILRKPSKIINTIINKMPDLIVSNQLLSVEERIELIKEFEESNQKVAREYLARPNSKLFYSSPIS